MQLKFYKYQGTGNDFVIIDNFQGLVDLSKEQIAHLCDRKFGIGADGLMLLEKSNKYDFEMKYYNADGNLGSMCGNGGRCIVKFAQDIDLIDEHAMFLAYDGVHEASIDKNGIVSLEMSDVNELIKIDNATCELNTGSPHYVSFVNDVLVMDVFKSGREIRYNDNYKMEGINVNFVTVDGERLTIRTYERGVENETLSCGTGVTAAAIAAYHLGLIKSTTVSVKAVGGELSVSFDCNENQFENVVLSGPAIKSFEGTIEL
jgi:diaminopimelate epimerase